MFSYWEKTSWFSDYDFAIVGCGIVGICSAIELRQKHPKANIIVLERGPLPAGASTKNAGFACFGTVGELLDDLNHQSEAELLQTINMRWQGLQLLKGLVPADKMDLQDLGGTELIDSEDQFTEYEQNLDYINSLLSNATGQQDIIKLNSFELGSGFFHSCFYNKYESQLNPALMMSFLIRKARSLGVDVQFNYELKEYTQGAGTVLLTNGDIELKTNTLIFTTNAFAPHFFSDIDVIPARNQVLVSDKIANLNWNGCFHYDRGYVYFRNIGDRILLGGARNIDPENETTDSFGSNDVVIQHLKDFSRRLNIPDLNFTHQWSGIIATGRSKRPIVRSMDDNIFVAVRLGGMGVAIGAGVAKTLCNSI